MPKRQRWVIQWPDALEQFELELTRYDVNMYILSRVIIDYLIA